MNAMNQTSDTLLFSVLIAAFVGLTALSVATTTQAAPSATNSLAVAAATSGHS